MSVPWGQKALKGYLGEDKETWKQYDGSELAKVHSVACLLLMTLRCSCAGAVDHA